MIEEHDHEYRVGIGTDIHQIQPGRRLMLGGVLIPDAAGLAGHSDGDVAIHAICDALLGATAMGDIGDWFPDTDMRWKDADSKEFLFVIKQQLEEKRWLVNNVDLVIEAAEPRLGPFKAQIKRCIASLLGIDFNAVNIKAKSGNGIGPVGEGEAMAATAAVLVKRKYKRTL